MAKKVSKSQERRLAAQKEEVVEKVDYEVSNAPLTGITYRNLPGGKVIITGFYGFLTLKEIGEQYGEDVLSVYEENECRVALIHDHDGDEELRIWDKEGEIYFDLYDGEILSNDEFSDIIKLIKKCGSYLHDLKLAIKSEEKTIGI